MISSYRKSIINAEENVVLSLESVAGLDPSSDVDDKQEQTSTLQIIAPLSCLRSPLCAGSLFERLFSPTSSFYEDAVKDLNSPIAIDGTEGMLSSVVAFLCTGSVLVPSRHAPDIASVVRSAEAPANIAEMTQLFPPQTLRLDNELKQIELLQRDAEYLELRNLVIACDRAKWDYIGRRVVQNIYCQGLVTTEVWYWCIRCRSFFANERNSNGERVFAACEQTAGPHIVCEDRGKIRDVMLQQDLMM